MTTAIAARYRVAATVDGAGPHEVAADDRGRAVRGRGRRRGARRRAPPAPSTTDGDRGRTPRRAQPPAAPATTPTTRRRSTDDGSTPSGMGRGTRLLVAGVLAVRCARRCGSSGSACAAALGPMTLRRDGSRPRASTCAPHPRRTIPPRRPRPWRSRGRPSGLPSRNSCRCRPPCSRRSTPHRSLSLQSRPSTTENPRRRKNLRLLRRPNPRPRCWKRRLSVRRPTRNL